MGKVGVSKKTTAHEKYFNNLLSVLGNLDEELFKIEKGYHKNNYEEKKLNGKDPHVYDEA